MKYATALASQRKYGPEGVRGPATVGVCLNAGVLLLIAFGVLVPASLRR